MKKVYLLPLFAFFFATAAPAQTVSPVVGAPPGFITQTAQTQAAMTPETALEMLKEGNARFVENRPLARNYAQQIALTASGQYPHSVILACIDSRGPVEVIFDQGIGDVFVPRVAGNFVNTDILGSMEFATAVAGARLVVVLGHTECGAVKGACDRVVMGNLTSTLANIAPALYTVSINQEIEGERSSKNKAFVHAVTVENVRETVKNITDRSAVIAELVESGKVRVVGALHDVSTGRVTFLD